VALRAYGCPTFASCQGHFTWGDARPWVDIKLPGARPRCQEDEDSYAVVWSLERRTRLALGELLDSFYARRSHVPHHARLVVHRLGAPGWLQVSTVGLDAGLELRGEQRWTWLRHGWREVHSFAGFLKTQFLKNGPIVGRRPILSRAQEIRSEIR
jgi:hypothetical protein